MSTFSFYKYQGTGNDFVLIDNRTKHFEGQNRKLIVQLCDRKFGIGSDGLILIQHSTEADFEMVFFNPDGSTSFCGNGSRCAVAFAHRLGLIGDSCTFKAIDGLHSARIMDTEVEISIRDVSFSEVVSPPHFIHTGSPHYVAYVDKLDTFPLLEKARAIRYSAPFAEKGTNVNFVEIQSDRIRVRTYERGVEDETLSCGSGVTACALSFAIATQHPSPCRVETRGGLLQVFYQSSNYRDFTGIFLRGPAEAVFKGEWNG